VVLNKFPTDTDAEIEIVRESVSYTAASGFAVSDGVAKGGMGAAEFAQTVIDVIGEEPVHPQFIYDLDEPIETKIEKIAKTIYGAGGIKITPKAQGIINQLKKDGYNDLPICMAKTHLSLSDDPTLKGVPTDFDITISDCKISAGAGFIYPITGKMLTMPGLPPIPAAENIDIDEDGKITGLF
ncbi:MAG: formate--tetrahydrofolate ligase, partial [Candidatus Kariarchaeaceae archaeon]